jgi:hypothetical protein
MKPTTGYYRQLLRATMPNVRIALSNVPITGCSRIDKEPVLQVLDASTDPYAKYYADGIRSGALTAITENPPPDRVFRSGELYFTT